MAKSNKKEVLNETAPVVEEEKVLTETPVVEGNDISETVENEVEPENELNEGVKVVGDIPEGDEKIEDFNLNPAEETPAESEGIEEEDDIEDKAEAYMKALADDEASRNFTHAETENVADVFHPDFEKVEKGEAYTAQKLYDGRTGNDVNTSHLDRDKGRDGLVVSKCPR